MKREYVPAASFFPATITSRVTVISLASLAPVRHRSPYGTIAPLSFVPKMLVRPRL